MDGEQSTSRKKEYEPLSCSAIVYRALLRKQWIDKDTERVKADAFFLRKNKNEKVFQLILPHTARLSSVRQGLTNVLH
ncbi:hypothetical protein [Nostoc sp.]|uniref:hypothetical protein n=1 Tax=Nostoc sp. TaxID=1180 RepID=UPI002FF78824